MDRVLQQGFILGAQTSENRLIWGGVIWVLLNCSYAYIAGALVAYIEPAAVTAYHKPHSDPNPNPNWWLTLNPQR